MSDRDSGQPDLYLIYHYATNAPALAAIFIQPQAQEAFRLRVRFRAQEKSACIDPVGDLAGELELYGGEVGTWRASNQSVWSQSVEAIRAAMPTDYPTVALMYALARTRGRQQQEEQET